MKTVNTPFAFLFLIIVISNYNSASNKLHESKSIGKIVRPHTHYTTAIEQTDSTRKIFGGRPISFYLAHREIPQVCKDLYSKKRPASDDSDILALMDSIFTSNNETRPFYFLTLTMTMEKADGAYAEPLGMMGKQFVQTRSKEFINYFLNELILTEKDFDQWARTVAGEIQISSGKEEQDEVYRIKNKMITNCSGCKKEQTQKINEFINRLQYYCP